MVDFRSPTQQENAEDIMILYGHGECPMVSRTRGLLERSGVLFQYVDIRANEAGRLYIREINQGNESVPTLLFPDGTTLTEPSSQTLCHKLESMGYICHIPRWVSLFEALFKRVPPF